MTTSIGLWLDSSQPERHRVLEKARQFVCDAAARLSRFLPESELSQLNVRAGHGPQRVSPLLWELASDALELAKFSGGLVDPTILPALVRAGYGPGSPAGKIDYSAVKLSSEPCSIELPDGMALDFGGFAKGWLADRIAKTLSAHGSTLVDMGGDIRAVGPRLWRLGIEDPFSTERDVVTFDLYEAGVATSSVLKRSWESGGHHVIDPRSQQPSRSDLVAVTVKADTALAAEVAAKVVLILGSDEGSRFLQSRRLVGVLIGKDKSVRRVGKL